MSNASRAHHSCSCILLPLKPINSMKRRWNGSTIYKLVLFIFQFCGSSGVFNHNSSLHCLLRSWNRLFLSDWIYFYVKKAHLLWNTMQQRKSVIQRQLDKSCYIQIESQNCRGWKGPPEIIESNPPAKVSSLHQVAQVTNCLVVFSIFWISLQIDSSFVYKQVSRSC